ncbi:MAG: phosphoribosyltransferase [Bacteroidetes bacterium]|nr:phosphoribosyltransferase [Bacteroidota bacterium]
MTTPRQTHILGHEDIQLKLERMVWQILEHKHGHTNNGVVLFGIERKGMIVARQLAEVLRKIRSFPVTIGSITLDKDNPNGEVVVEGIENAKDSHILLVDDVLNSGKTLMYAAIPLLKEGPASMHTVVLANRDHTTFPIKADIVGISLATTLQEHITFDMDADGRMSVYLS